VLIDNVGYNMPAGLEIWKHLQDSDSNPGLGTSTIEDSHFAGPYYWLGNAAGVHLPYANHLTFKDVTVLGGSGRGRGFGFAHNNKTGNYHFENVTVAGYGTGISQTERHIRRISCWYLSGGVSLGWVALQSLLKTATPIPET
jgi:hypothetical protein